MIVNPVPRAMTSTKTTVGNPTSTKLMDEAGPGLARLRRGARARAPTGHLRKFSTP